MKITTDYDNKSVIIEQVHSAMVFDINQAKQLIEDLQHSVKQLEKEKESEDDG